MKELIVHSLKMHKVQSVSIAVSVALAVMVLMTFGLVYGGTMQGVRISKERAGADVMAVPSDSTQYLDGTELLYTGAPAPIYMKADVVEQIAGAEGATRVSPQFYSQTLNKSCCSSTGSTRLIGIDPQSDFVVSGLVGEDAVRALDDDSIILGSDVQGAYEGKFKIYGKEYRVLAVAPQTGTEFDSSIMIGIDQARQMSRDLEGYGHYWKKYGDPSGLVSCVMVDVDHADEASSLAAVKGKITLTGVATALVRSDVVEKSQGQLESVFALLAVAAAIMLVVTLLQLFARFFSSVWERKSELALYRALGASKSDLVKMTVGESGALVGAGLVVGLVLGFVAQAALLAVMQDGLAFPYVALGPGACALLALGVIAVFALIALLSLVWPLRQIGRLDPSTAMQQGDID